MIIIISVTMRWMHAGKLEKLAAFDPRHHTVLWNLDSELVSMSTFIISQVEKVCTQVFNSYKRYVRITHARAIHPYSFKPICHFWSFIHRIELACAESALHIFFYVYRAFSTAVLKLHSGSQLFYESEILVGQRLKNERKKICSKDSTVLQ